MNLAHNLRYAFKCMLRNKTTLIWTLIFPIGLATFMFAAFGNLFEADEMFKSIPVAVIHETKNEAFETMVDMLSGDKEDDLFHILSEEEEEAERLLADEKIEAIIYIREEPQLVVKKDGTKVTIIKTIFEEYKKNEKVILDIAEKDKLAAVRSLASMLKKEQKQYYIERSSSHGVQNEFYSYFYAVFAMSCLFASFAGAEKIGKLQANQSALGMRRSLSSTTKACVVISEFIAMVVWQFLIELVVLGYMTLLGIDFGDRYPAIMLVLFFGSAIGLSMGMIIGSLNSVSSGLRQGICVSISMVLSVLADLCVAGLKNTIEHTMPILNRINPAALISDSLYALNIYENYDRFIRNILTMGVMACVLVVITFMILRRNKYASL